MLAFTRTTSNPESGGHAWTVLFGPRGHSLRQSQPDLVADRALVKRVT